MKAPSPRGKPGETVLRHVGEGGQIGKKPQKRDQLTRQHEASHCSGRTVQIIEQRSRPYSSSLAPEMH